MTSRISKLKAAGFGHLPYRLIPDKPAWSVVVSDMARATEERRRAACYVVFTCKEMLPPEITPDMIGGKLGLPGKEHVTDFSNNIKA